MSQCRNFKSSELRAIMEESAEIEELVKTGRLGDVMGVEVFIVKYSTPVVSLIFIPSFFTFPAIQ